MSSFCCDFPTKSPKACGFIVGAGAIGGIIGGAIGTLFLGVKTAGALYVASAGTAIGLLTGAAIVCISCCLKDQTPPLKTLRLQTL
ncbi:MAG: hypothetical protein P0S93_01850 [Candidatus Neptunochlamydia sp.]|nr:hypothetical protein [Candidatus Neptunochlamydia sp.]